MPTVTTPRVSGAITAGNSKRVITSGEVPASATVFSNDTWHRTWGNTWGHTWFNQTGAAATPASPVIAVTSRVSGTAAGGQTKRIPADAV